ncbi:MAG TPA: hypothetical protein VEI58_08305 [Chthoniobacterales bacterium]|nr:hypothetical protein [Chthoniobacterales bacterium]
MNGTPLPERHEGTSFFGGKVDRRQFQPIYFDFDSQTIRSSESGKIQQIADFMKGGGNEIIKTVSFGAEMQADSGHSEAAWAKNRRAEIGVVK